MPAARQWACAWPSSIPERIRAHIVQNANAYEEGFSPAWAPFRALWADRNAETGAGIAAFCAPQFTQFFYTEGTRELDKLNPDAWDMDQLFIDRPVNQATNMELFYDCRNNPGHYARWQACFRQHQPPTLIVWGQGDPFFTMEGAKAYLRDLPKADFHHLNAGHSALEEEGGPSPSTSAASSRARWPQRQSEQQHGRQAPVSQT